MLQKIDKDRLDEVSSVIKTKKIRFPIAELAKKTGLDKGQISNYLSGKKPMSDNFYTSFIEHYGHSKPDSNVSENDLAAFVLRNTALLTVLLDSQIELLAEVKNLPLTSVLREKLEAVSKEEARLRAEFS